MEVSMSTSSHYDLIIIDTGPDSGRLVCMLVPSEKKSLLLEPDGYPRARRTTKSTNKTSHPSASRFVSMIDLRQARTIPSNEHKRILELRDSGKDRSAMNVSPSGQAIP